MARTLTAAMKTALAAESGYGDVWLLSLTSSGGTLRFTSAPEDQLWDGNTWSAIGGDMRFDQAAESDDLGSQQVGLMLGGVDQTIVAVLLGNDYRGYGCTLYFGQVLHSTGAIVDDPMAVFTGLLNRAWTVHEQMTDRGPGSVEIRTTVVGEMANAQWHAAVRTNLQSHQDMLDRAGLGVTDTFFKTVPDIASKRIKWGSHRVGDTAPGEIPEPYKPKPIHEPYGG